MVTDVAERTEAQPETQAPPATETQAPRGTDQSGAVQTGPGTEAPETQPSTPPTARERRVQALSEAERQEEQEKGRQAERDSQRSSLTKEQREAQRRRYQQSFPLTMQTVRGILNKSVDEYRTLSSEEVSQVLNAIEGHNLIGFQANAQEVSDLIRDGVLGLLPQDLHEEFGKATMNPDGSGVDLDKYFTTAVEMAAPHSKWAHNLDLESAKKSSAKLRRELEAELLAAHDEGRDEGLNAPPGTNPDGGRSAQRSAPGNKTYNQLEEGYGAGTLSRDEEALYKKMRQERARAR